MGVASSFHESKTNKSVYFVTGFIKNEKGDPQKNVRLRLFEIMENGEIGQNAVLSQKSDSQGYYQLELGNPYGYQMEVESNNWLYRKTYITIPLGSDTKDVVLLETGEAEIFGVITDEKGIPIPDVVITNGSGEYRSNSDHNGRYVLKTVIPSSHLPVVSYFKSGFKEIRNSFSPKEISAIARIERNVVLKDSIHTTVFSMLVYSPYGEPITNRRVRMHSLPNNLLYTAYTDETGYALFEGIRTDATYKMEVDGNEEYAPYVKYSVDIEHNMPPVFVNLEKVETTTISGVITDEFGNPIPNMSLKFDSDKNPVADLNFTTDSFGRFADLKVPTGEVVLRTTRSPHYKVTGLRVGRTLSRDFNVPLNIGWHRVSGQVLDGIGLPIQNARVVMKGSKERGDLLTSVTRSTRTFGDGLFEFVNVGSGKHIVTAYVDGSTKLEIPYDTESENHQIQLVFD